MTTILITPPTAEPLTLDQMKADLRIEDTDRDPSLNRMMVEARQYVERRLELSLLTQTRELQLDSFPANLADPIVVNYGPIQSIESLQYDDQQGTHTIDPAGYYFRDVRVFPVDKWPGSTHAVRLRFLAGLEAPADVPGPIVQAIRLHTQQAFDGLDNTKAIDAVLAQYWKPVA